MGKSKNLKTKKKFKGFTMWEIAVNIQKCQQLIENISNVESTKLSSEKSYENYVLALIADQLLVKFNKINANAFDFGEVRKVKFTELEQQIALMLGLITEHENVKFNAAISNKMRLISKTGI